MSVSAKRQTVGIASKSDSASQLREAQRAYIRMALVRDPRKRSLTEIARDGGINPSTLTRFMNDKAHRHALSSLTMRRIAEVVKLPLSSDIAGPAVTGLREEAEPYIATGADPDLRRLVDILIGGRNGADPWILTSGVLEAEGYRPGDLVIVDLNALPAKEGDCVCAQVYDRSGATAETVWRVYNPPFLMAAPLVGATRLKPLMVDNDRVVIRGVITDCLRRRR